MASKYTIYGLLDPRRPDVVRYVGATSKTMPVRLKGHTKESLLKDSNTPKSKWFRALAEKKITPLIVELDVCENDHHRIEGRWVCNFRMSRAAPDQSLLNQHLPEWGQRGWEFYVRLKTWRGEYAQKQAAYILGIPLATYRNWESGTNLPHRMSMKEVDRILQKTIEEQAPDDWPKPIKTKPDDAAGLSKKLRDWRAKEKITSKTAAATIGVPLDTYRGWEAGRHLPNTLAKNVIRACMAAYPGDQA